MDNYFTEYCSMIASLDLHRLRIKKEKKKVLYSLVNLRLHSMLLNFLDYLEVFKTWQAWLALYTYVFYYHAIHRKHSSLMW